MKKWKEAPAVPVPLSDHKGSAIQMQISAGAIHTGLRSGTSFSVGPFWLRVISSVEVTDFVLENSAVEAFLLRFTHTVHSSKKEVWTMSLSVNVLD